MEKTGRDWLDTAKKMLLKGYREEYIPGWNQGCEALYQEFLDREDENIGMQDLNDKRGGLRLLHH